MEGIRHFYHPINIFHWPGFLLVPAGADDLGGKEINDQVIIGLYRLRLYLLLLIVLFVLQLTAVIVSFATGQKIID